MTKKPHSIWFGSKLTTRWTDEVGDIPLPEYPRPQLRRQHWQNLNGIWQYTITSQTTTIPDSFDDPIRVPFCIESRLSEVGRPLLPDQILWYKRTFEIPRDWNTKRIRLHFGAVDWKARIFVNHAEIGSHRGGYLPFSFDITDSLVNGKNTLIVAVQDTTDAQMHQRGKQVLHPQGIFYTPCSGIWQTVWLEPTDTHAIASLKITPDIDQGKVGFDITQFSTDQDQILEVEVEDKVTTFQGVETFDLEIEDPVYWTPSNPHLYNTKIRIIQDDTLLDEVETYFAMRKFSKGPDTNGQMRLLLNNKPIFHLGPLDQGFWPDGIYTAPTEEALVFDLARIKEMGFNTIRKHVKVESARWYYHCDRLGMMVWQDMVNGGKEGWNWRAWLSIIIKSTYIRDDSSPKHLKLVGRTEMALQEEFRQELQEMIDSLYNYPCIAVWVPFNEGWGQFSAGEVGDWLMRYDPTRLVDTTSGFNLHGPTDIRSWHIYMRKLKMVEKKPDPNWVLAFSEAGGYGLRVPQHLWDETDRSRFYGNAKSSENLLQKYENLLLDQLPPLTEQGISALIYTQTTDVETEVNGLLTYDREEKIPSSLIHKINTEFLRQFGDISKSRNK